MALARALGGTLTLFARGDYTLHGGQQSLWKIDCDALTDEDLDTMAFLLWQRLPLYCTVEGIPTGGDRLARVMAQYCDPKGWRHLIVDDVLTTGGSMTKARRAAAECMGQDLLDPAVIGAVLFARTDPPSWVSALWVLDYEEPFPRGD